MLQDAQSTMRRNYINGGPGVFVSGLTWVIAAGVTYYYGFQLGMLSLFLGGMLIVPLSGLIENHMKVDVPTPDKGLTRLAILTLPLLFGGLFLGYVMSMHNEALFFEIMAVAIGVRYLVFSRIYRLKAFIALGLILTGVGIAGQFVPLSLTVVPLIVGVVELVFGTFLMNRKAL